MFLIMIWWFVSARKWFKGPVINVEHHMLGRQEGVVEGLEKEDSGSDANAPPHYTKSREVTGEEKALELQG